MLSAVQHAQVAGKQLGRQPLTLRSSSVSFTAFRWLTVPHARLSRSTMRSSGCTAGQGQEAALTHVEVWKAGHSQRDRREMVAGSIQFNCIQQQELIIHAAY